MIVMLKPGERVQIQFLESDGELVVEFDVDGDGHLRVLADLPDSSGREGVIYDEDFSRTPLEAMEEGPEDEHGDADDVPWPLAKRP